MYKFYIWQNKIYFFDTFIIIKKLFQITGENVYFDLVSQSKIIFTDKNYRLSGAIFYHGGTVLRDHFTIACPSDFNFS